MQVIEGKILNKIKKCGRGKLYSASDFAVYGSAVSVAKALERLTRKGGLVRIARGLYCYPKIDRKFGLGIQYPTINEIAEKVGFSDPHYFSAAFKKATGKSPTEYAREKRGM